MLEVPPEWNEVLMMEDKDVRPATEAAVKRKIDEVAQGRRKQRKENYIRPEKPEHSPTVSWRTRNSEGFYSEDWNETLQEEEFPVLKTKEADVAYLRSREKKPKCREG